MLLGLSSVTQFSLANNPTSGYCQTVDPSVCGWGSSAPAQQKWFVGVRFDPTTGAYGSYYATDRDTALRLAYKSCQSLNIVNGKQKRCLGKITSSASSASNTTPFVLARGQHADGKYGFNLRYNGYGTKSFWPQGSTSSTLSPVDAALDDCQNKFKLQNCVIIP